MCNTVHSSAITDGKTNWLVIGLGLGSGKKGFKLYCVWWPITRIRSILNNENPLNPTNGVSDQYISDITWGLKVKRNIYKHPFVYYKDNRDILDVL